VTGWAATEPYRCLPLLVSVTLAGMPPTQRKSSKPAGEQPEPDQPDQPAETEDVEVHGTGPEGEWRPETHGESPAERPKSGF
jgi:hypothetical protein